MDSDISITKEQIPEVINTKLENIRGVEFGIGKDGKINVTIKDGKYNATQKKALQNAVDILNEFNGTKGEDIINLRRRLDDVINWEGKTATLSTLDKEIEKVIRTIRKGVDEIAGEALQGLKDTDAKFSELIKETETLKKDWFNADGSMKDNAQSRMRNMNSNANVSRLERLEKYIPGVSEDIKALQALNDIERAMQNKVGTYARGGLASGGIIGSILAGNPATAAFAVVGFLATNPKTVISVLKGYGLLKRRSNEKLQKVIKSGKISKELESDIKIEVKKQPKVIEEVVKNMTEEEIQDTMYRQPDLFDFNKAAPATVAKSMNEAMSSHKVAVYVDNKGNPISQGAYRNIQNFKNQIKNFNNAVKRKDYIAQYDAIDISNGLGHRLVKQAGDNSYEKQAYDLQIKFAKSEVNRLGKQIIGRDHKVKMYFIRRPDGRKGPHLGFKFSKRFQKQK